MSNLISLAYARDMPRLSTSLHEIRYKLPVVLNRTNKTSEITARIYVQFVVSCEKESAGTAVVSFLVACAFALRHLDVN